MNRPTAGAKDQVARLLTLVPLLHAHGEMPLGAAAEALDVTPAQVLSDLKVLFMVGLPGGYPEDLIDVDLDALEGPGGPNAAGMIRVSNADYLARPLRLSPTEATAMIVALRAMRDGAADDTREIVDRVLAKLEAAAAEGPAAARIDPGVDTREPRLTALADRLRDAAERHVQVRLTYYVPSRDEESERLVDPRGVVSAQGMTYLDAWCHSAEAPRLFRIDRIASAEVTDQPIETPVEAPRDLSEGIFAQSEDTSLVTLRLAPPARWVVEYYPVEAVRTGNDGTLEVDLLVADDRWLLRLLLRLAPHASVLSPPEYAQEFTRLTRETLALY
jgi:proteasome accessory factor C